MTVSTNSHEATATLYCKQPGCENEARSSVGRYSYCSTHQDRAARGAPPARASVRASGTLAGRIATLAADARKVDAAKAKAAKLATRAIEAKRRADELEAALAARLREITAAS